MRRTLFLIGFVGLVLLNLGVFIHGTVIPSIWAAKARLDLVAVRVTGMAFHVTYTTPEWASDTAYTADDVVNPTTGGVFSYKATNSGTSGSSEPTWPTTYGNTVVDNGVTWECVISDNQTDVDISASATIYDEEGGDVKTVSTTVNFCDLPAAHQANVEGLLHKASAYMNNNEVTVTGSTLPPIQSCP